MALISASALSNPLPPPVFDSAGGSSSVAISFQGMRSARGNILVCLTRNPNAFPDCSDDASATRLRVAAAGAGTMRVAVPTTGDYAIAVIHDENANGRLDTMLAMPREGFGFSRNPRIGMGPPRFSAASFAVGDDPVRQDVRIRYML